MPPLPAFPALPATTVGSVSSDPATPPAAIPDPALLDQVEGLLAELVASLVPTAPLDGAIRRSRGRPPILPAALLWSGLVVGVLRGAPSQRDLWRLISGTGLWHFPAVAVTDDAVYKRLDRGGGTAMAGLFADVTRRLLARVPPDLTLAPFAADVVAVDETTLDPVARRLPGLRGVPPRDVRLLPGKLAGVFDVRRQLWRRVEHVEAPRQNEKVAARGLVAARPVGSLILADLSYFAFPWFNGLTDAGQWWVSRMRTRTSYQVLHVGYQDGETLDAIVWLGAHRADKAKHAVRLVQFRQGGELRRYLTNVQDAEVLPLADIARLYARRWDVEMAVDLAKTKLGLHLLWSAKTAVVLTQVWAVLLVAQVLQALRIEVAVRAEVDPFDVSLPLLVRHLPRYARHAAQHGGDPIAAFVADGRRLRFIRPSRRLTILVPAVPPEAWIPPPADLVLVRTPRYANRKPGPRGATA